MHSRRFVMVALMAMVVFVAGAARAQMGRMTAEERVDRLVKSLDLSDDQKAKVLEVFKAQDEARQKAFAEHQGDRDAMREAMAASRKETDTKMKEILTEEQYKKWDAQQKEMMQRFQRN